MVEKDHVEEVAGVQRLLGSINDARIVRDLLADLSGGSSVAAALKKRQRKKTREFRRLWSDLFSEPGTARQWMNALLHRSEPPVVRKPMGRGVPVPGAPEQAREA